MNEKATVAKRALFTRVAQAEILSKDEIKVLGFQVKKTGETRANGKIWMIEPIDINSK